MPPAPDPPPASPARSALGIDAALFDRLPGLLAVVEVDAASGTARIAEANAGWRAAFGASSGAPLPAGEPLAAAVRHVAAGHPAPDAPIPMALHADSQEVSEPGEPAGSSAGRTVAVFVEALGPASPVRTGGTERVLLRADAPAAGTGPDQDAEERYRVFLDLSAEGVWRCDVDAPIDTALSPDAQLDAFYAHGYLAECNGAFARMYGFEGPEPLLGTRLTDLLPRDDPRNEAYLRAWIASDYRLTGVESHERARDGTPLVFENSITGQIEAGRLLRAWGTQRDVTARWQAEQNRLFLADLDARLRLATTAEAVFEASLEPLCDRLGGANCSFVEVDDAAGTVTGLRLATERSGRRVGAPLAPFVTPAFLDALSRGEVIALDDLATHPLSAPAYPAYRRLGLRAILIAPLSRDGRWAGALQIGDVAPRAWRPDEVHLIAAVAARVWPAVERARAETALRESEDRFRHLADHVPAMIWLTDAAGTCTYISHGWHAFTGQTHTEALERGWADAIHEDDRAAALAAFDAAHDTQGPCRITYRLRRLDGTYRWVRDEARPRFDDRGAFLGHAGVVIDVTDRVEAEQAMRESEWRFRQMADSIPQLAWIAEADGAIYWYNNRWYAYTGTTLESMQGWGWKTVHHPDHVDEVSERFLRHIASGEPWEDTFPIRSADGEFRWFLSRARPVHGPDGAVVKWFGTNTDITDQRALEAALRDLNADLEARVAERTAQLESANALLETRNRDLHDFAHVASHDLQEPLRKVRQFADLLAHEEAAALSAEGRRYLERIQDASQRMSRLISALLAYSRVATRTDPTVAVPLGEALADVLSDLDLRIHETRGHVEVPAPLPTIVADATQVRQLLQNLVGNALKFHREGVPPVVRVTSERAAGAHRLVVEDNGIGFDPRHADRIFAPFQRLHTRDSYEGSGVGLAIVRRIAERHGWTVSAESAPGEGSRFTVTIPDSG